MSLAVHWSVIKKKKKNQWLSFVFAEPTVIKMDLNQKANYLFDLYLFADELPLMQQFR